MRAEKFPLVNFEEDSPRAFVMRYLLYLAVAVVCEGARIPRTVEQPYFPNFQSVYHGNGASSYQNVQVDQAENPLLRDYKVQDENLALENVYEENQIAGIPRNLVDHLAEFPFEEIGTNHLNNEPEHDLLQDYERSNHGHDYEY
ncbi:uncharacterized protein LOC128873421 isoform X1 [Hylaeus volcanicus]|uniref:uncharacterized protein LOC128873421 isoform X1 n=1 Tax=Hylaeus volcanicus TaxID=313075 RepID=UPI0023B81E2B|nr:uncharacterized protein LOC128873421 isoform X1 [Hylaeus volcanicus]